MINRCSRSHGVLFRQFKCTNVLNCCEIPGSLPNLIQIFHATRVEVITSYRLMVKCLIRRKQEIIKLKYIAYRYS